MSRRSRHDRCWSSPIGGPRRRGRRTPSRRFATPRALGADWVELDVRRTADGALPSTTTRVLPDGRVIVELAAADLPPTLPSLADALRACDGMGVNIEIKNDPDDPDFDPDDRVAIAVAELLERADRRPAGRPGAGDLVQPGRPSACCTSGARTCPPGG